MVFPSETNITSNILDDTGAQKVCGNHVDNLSHSNRKSAEDRRSRRSRDRRNQSSVDLRISGRSLPAWGTWHQSPPRRTWYHLREAREASKIKRSWGETWWNMVKHGETIENPGDDSYWQLDFEQMWSRFGGPQVLNFHVHDGIDMNWHELTPQSNSPSAFLYPTALRLPQRGAKDIFFFRTLKMLVHCFSCWNKRGPKVSRSGFSSFTLMYNGEEKYLPGCLFCQETGKSIWSIWSRSECSFQLLWARSSCI